MSVSSPFIARPIATSLLTFAIVLGGLLGYLALPVSSLPQVDFPTIEVTTALPGADPRTMSELVTASLERQLGQIQALNSVSSTSSFGLSQIRLQFDLNRRIDDAAQDVQAAINAATSSLNDMARRKHQKKYASTAVKWSQNHSRPASSLSASAKSSNSNLLPARFTLSSEPGKSQ